MLPQYFDNAFQCFHQLVMGRTLIGSGQLSLNDGLTFGLINFPYLAHGHL